MQAGQSGIIHQRQAVFEHGFGFGGKAGDQIGAERGLGPITAHCIAKGDGVGAGVAAS